jgi:hypothetical protein
MNRNDTAWLATASLVGAMAFGSTAGFAADEAAALATQTERTDALAARRGHASVSSRISGRFANFAGSRANADALVAGLRSGSEIKLVTAEAKGAATSTTFISPTGKMGYGSVYLSLALAKEQLAQAGITRPTVQQLQASLLGGTVTAGTSKTTLDGVLQLRSQNMGWGQIAQSLGFKLGHVISGMKSANAQLAAPPATSRRAPTAVAGTATSQGIVTGAGASSASARQTPGTSPGVVTGAGRAAGSGHGHAYGRGVVTAGGASAGTSTATSGGHGKALGKVQ